MQIEQGLADELAELIETRLLGVPLDEQDLELEDDDWHTIIAALRQHEQMREALAESESDGWERGMIEAANICGSLAETTYDDADSFEAATGCEAVIRSNLNTHRRARAALNQDKPHD